MSLVKLPQSSHVPRDGWGRPLVVPKAGGKPVGHTRTTTFIDAIEDKSNLTKWKARSALLGAVKHPDLAAEAQGLDVKQDKAKLDALVEKLMDASGANDKRNKGTDLHALSELADAGLPLPDGTSEADVEDMMSYMLGITDFTFRHVEKLVVVNSLCVAGTPDRVGYYTGPGPKPGIHFDNELLITDLKTGSIEYGKEKMASQLAIYSRGEFYDHQVFGFSQEMQHDEKAFAAWKKTEFDADLAATAYTSVGNVNQEWGVIFSLPSGTAELELKWVDLTIGWDLAELCLRIRKARSQKGAMLPFAS